MVSNKAEPGFLMLRAEPDALRESIFGLYKQEKYAKIF